jgi:hypothetical protein
MLFYSSQCTRIYVRIGFQRATDFLQQALGFSKLIIFKEIAALPEVRHTKSGHL